MSQTARSYSTVPEGVEELLISHLPHSLPLLRRLQFTTFEGGITPTSNIIFSPDIPQIVASVPENRSDQPKVFAAAYLDFSRGPETEMWIYSTLEDGEVDDADKVVGEDQVLAVLQEAKRIGREYVRGGRPVDAVLIGTLSTKIRQILIGRQIKIRPSTNWEYEKWLFKLDQVPARDFVRLEQGMNWAPATMDDLQLVLSRTHIPREV